MPNFASDFTAGEAFVIVKVVKDPPDQYKRGGLWTFGSDPKLITYYPYRVDNDYIYDDWGTTKRKNAIKRDGFHLGKFNIYNVTSGSGSWVNRLNGNQLRSETGNEVGFTTSPEIGRSLKEWVDGSTKAWLDGDIAEMVVYSKTLNTAERTLVENYLSAKYDISIAAANDKYEGDASAKGHYDLDVAGVGREADGTNLIAHSAGMILQVTGSDPANYFLNDAGDYVVVGHKEPGFGVTNTELPSGVTHRWTRVWYLDKTEGDSGTTNRMTLAFDISAAGGTGTFGTVPDKYYLLRRPGTSGNFVVVDSVQSQHKSFNGDTQVLFEVGDDCLASDWYYTLGSNNQPLAVTVSEFNASSPLFVTAVVLGLGAVTLVVQRKLRRR